METIIWTKISLVIRIVLGHQSCVYKSPVVTFSWSLALATYANMFSKRVTTAAKGRFFKRHKVSNAPWKHPARVCLRVLPWFEWFKRTVSLFKLPSRTTKCCAIKNIENGDTFYGKQRRTFPLLDSHRNGTKQETRNSNVKRVKLYKNVIYTNIKIL